MPGVSTRGGRRAEVAAVDAPCISLRALREGDRATIRALRDALHTAPGWFTLDAEDAISPSMVRACYARAREFFSLPTALKRSYAHTQYARETGGYVPLLEEYAYRPNEIAILESFDTVRDLDASRVPAGATGVGPVDWPLECPGMKTALRAFYEAADEVARDVLRALARARFVGDGDDEDPAEAADAAALAARLLADFTEKSACSMRVMRYPGVEDARVRARVGGNLVGFEDSGLGVSGDARRSGDSLASERRDEDEDEDEDENAASARAARDDDVPKTVRTERTAVTRTDRLTSRSTTRGSRARAVGIAEHTDFECFTLLHQDSPGLLLRDRAGAWREAGVFSSPLGPRAAFTVIVGDAFERVSGGFFRATPHRVALTRHERFALVRFNGLDPEASIAPFAAADPKRARRATQGEHLARQVTRAARHLENAAKRGAVPGVDAARLGADAAPVKFAQLLIVAAGDARGDVSGSRAPSTNATDSSFVLLGKHRAGEFAGTYTGFIARVAPFETPRDAAMRAAEEGGVRFREGLSAASRDLPVWKNGSLHERARFRFEGWLADDRVAVEHEFVLRVKDAGDVTFEDARGRVPSGNEDVTEAPAFAAAVSRRKRKNDASNDASTEPKKKWFAREDVPYASMPADDAVWYPRLFALLDADEARDAETRDPSTASLEPRVTDSPVDRPGFGTPRSAWTKALAGRFAFDEAGALRRDWEVSVLATDAAM